MDVSQAKGSANTPFSWGVNYQDTETEKFAVFLDDQDTDPEPVHETRSREKDEPYEKADYADEEIDERDDRDNLEALRSPEEDNISEWGEQLAAIPAPLPNTQSAPKIAASDTKASPEVQIPAAATPATAATTKTGSESVAPLANASENSGKNAKDVNAATKENSKATPSSTQAAANEVGKTGINGQAATAIKGTSATATGGATAALASQTASSVKQKTPVAAASPAKSSASAQASASSTDAGAVQGSAAGKLAKAGEPNLMEKMQAEESAKLAEKEVLSSKISEMLKNSKGKITSTSSKGGSASAKTSTLVSGQNVVASSIVPDTKATPAATAIGTITNATAQAEIPISIQPAANSPAPVVQQAPLDPATTGNSAPQSAAVPGVESSSANSASQSASANRVSMQAASPAEQVSTQITSAVRSGLDQIKIQLNPAELGLVHIKLEIGHDGRVMATIAANNQESLDLLQQDSKTLEQALKEAGFETDSGSLNFSLNQQKDQGDGFQTANQNDGSSMKEQGEDQIPPHQLQAYRSSSDSNLDIQV